MNSNPADLIRMILTLSLSLLLQAGAPAQAQQESSAPPSQTNAAAPNDKADQRGKDRAAFYFPGGTPQEFLAALQRNYRVQWSDVTSIPEEMRSVQIPALRINKESIEAILNNPRWGGFGRRGGRGGGGGGGAEAATGRPRARWRRWSLSTTTSAPSSGNWAAWWSKAISRNRPP